MNSFFEMVKQISIQYLRNYAIIELSHKATRKQVLQFRLRVPSCYLKKRLWCGNYGTVKTTKIVRHQLVQCTEDSVRVCVRACVRERVNYLFNHYSSLFTAKKNKQFYAIIIITSHAFKLSANISP